MSSNYEFAGMLYRSESEMLDAIVEAWMTASGANTDADVRDDLARRTDGELVDDLLGAWEFEDVSREDLIAAMAEFREGMLAQD